MMKQEMMKCNNMTHSSISFVFFSGEAKLNYHI